MNPSLRRRTDFHLQCADEAEQEFLATVACHEIRLAHPLREDLRDALEHPVADAVRVPVVDLLEVVDVGQRDAQRVPGALGTCDLLPQELVG